MGTKHSDSRREVLLSAAARLVRERGYEALTLEAVANLAGVSKGGLLYHFASKESLVAALVETLVEGFDSGMAASRREDPQAPGSFTRAYVRTAAPDRATNDDATAAALLAAVAMDPHMLEPMRARYASWRRSFGRDGLSGVDGHVAGLAADGLWLADLLDLHPPRGGLRRRIKQRLLRLAGGNPA